MTTRFSTATHNKILVKDEDFVMYNTSLCSDKYLSTDRSAAVKMDLLKTTFPS